MLIDPDIWSKLVGRVCGANFAAIYGRTKAMGYRSLTLPEGHTWESFTKFLLDTLPARLRNNYIKKFRTSIDFWHNTGGGLDEKVIAELTGHGYNIMRNGISNYTVMKNPRIIFIGPIPDNTDDIKSSKDLPSRKRMCYCMLKNDHIQYNRRTHRKDETERLNPNAVAPPKLKLLYDSIKEDGCTMPIVCYYDEENDSYIIVDGFHRYRIMLEYPDLYAREHGKIPV